MDRTFDTQDILDENYKIISRTTYAPDDTSSIEWRREGANAIGTFQSVRHAWLFITDHLNLDGKPDKPCAFRPEARGPEVEQKLALLAARITDSTQAGNAFHAAAGSVVLAKDESASPVDVPIRLSTLDTPALRGIIDTEPENHNTVAANDRKYKLLSTIRWSGSQTDRIEWRRDGQVAIGTFGYCEDAAGFIHGYLGGRRGDCFLQIESEDSLNHRGRIREEDLRKNSMVDLVDMPGRKPWGVSVEVKIPLRILDIDGLVERHTVHFYPGEVREVTDTPQPPQIEGMAPKR